MIPRPLYLDRLGPLMGTGVIKVLTGMRRTGKTSLCFQSMRELLASGVARERLLYLNFEDDRLAGVRVGDLQWIVEAFYGALDDLTLQDLVADNCGLKAVLQFEDGLHRRCLPPAA